MPAFNEITGENNFNFVPPELYAKINGRHLALNNQLLEEYGPELLGPDIMEDPDEVRQV